MTEIQIEPCVYKERPAILCRTPYHPRFVSEAKRLGGKWSPSSKAWVFDPRDRERVEALCREVYGTAGEEDCELVSVRIRALDEIWNLHEAVYFAGRVVARAWGRDSGAKLGPGVVQVAGERPRSGGSAKYWRTTIPKDAVFELRDLPRAAVEAAIAKERERGEEARWEIEVLDLPTVRELADQMGRPLESAPSNALEELWQRILKLPLEDQLEIRNRLLQL